MNLPSIDGDDDDDAKQLIYQNGEIHQSDVPVPKSPSNKLSGFQANTNNIDGATSFNKIKINICDMKREEEEEEKAIIMIITSHIQILPS